MMTVKQLKSIIAGLPPDYEVRAEVDIETSAYVNFDITVCRQDRNRERKWG